MRAKATDKHGQPGRGSQVIELVDQVKIVNRIRAVNKDYNNI